MILYHLYFFVGVEIDDCMMILDDDRMFLSQGETFSHPKGKKDSKDKNSSFYDQINEASNTDVGPYTVGELLGRGGFGEVRVGTNQLTGEKVALKFLRKADILSVGAAERTSTEIQCLATLSHPNIIKLFVVRNYSPYNLSHLFNVVFYTIIFLPFFVYIDSTDVLKV